MKKKELKKKIKHTKPTKKMSNGGEAENEEDASIDKDSQATEEEPKKDVAGKEEEKNDEPLEDDNEDNEDEDESDEDVFINKVEYLKDGETVAEKTFDEPVDFTDKAFKESIPDTAYDSAVVILSDDDVQALDKEDVENLSEGDITLDAVKEVKELEDEPPIVEEDKKVSGIFWFVIGAVVGGLVGINLNKKK